MGRSKNLSLFPGDFLQHEHVCPPAAVMCLRKNLLAPLCLSEACIMFLTWSLPGCVRRCCCRDPCLIELLQHNNFSSLWMFKVTDSGLLETLDVCVSVYLFALKQIWDSCSSCICVLFYHRATERKLFSLLLFLMQCNFGRAVSSQMNGKTTVVFSLFPLLLPIPPSPHLYPSALRTQADIVSCTSFIISCK